MNYIFFLNNSEKTKSGQEKGNKKSKKSKKKRDDDDDEDIEKVLAELELEYAGLKPKEEVKPSESTREEEKPKKKDKASKKLGSKKGYDLITEELRTMDEMIIDGDYDDDDGSAYKKKDKKKKTQNEVTKLSKWNKKILYLVRCCYC